MQLKLYKRCTAILFGLIIIIGGIGAWLLTNKEKWADKSFAIYMGLIIGGLVAFMAFSYYEMNADRNMIKKMVGNGDIALARIKSGGFERFARDSKLKRYVFWKLDVTLYDKNMKKIETSLIEKFNLKQTQIPQGNVYVTYDPANPERMFIVPNALISVFPDLQPIVESYEKNKDIKITYLNVYYKDGMVLESFKDSMKKEAKK